MKEEMIRCVHPNGKPCLLTKKATQDVGFMKKYGIRVEHVQKEKPLEPLNTEPYKIPAKAFEEKTGPKETQEAEAEAIDKQVADSLAQAEKPTPAKPKQTRKPRGTKPKTNKK